MFKPKFQACSQFSTAATAEKQTQAQQFRQAQQPAAHIGLRFQAGRFFTIPLEPRARIFMYNQWLAQG